MDRDVAASARGEPVGRRRDQLARLCTPPSGHALYALLDGAVVGELPQRLVAAAGEYVCLYRGELVAELAAVAPYLLRLDSAPAWRDRVFDHWGEHWGVLLTSRAGLRALRDHCRRLLLIRGPGQRSYYMRFYDPRVFPLLAASFDTRQLRELFGPIEYFWCEDSATQVRRYQLEAGRITSSSTRLG